MTYDKYEKLKNLNELKEKGALTEEEYQKEKEKILNEEPQSQQASKPAVLPKPLWGLDENTYLMLMHLSQFAGFVLPGLGFVAPVAMWIINKDANENVDKHGKNIVNFMISYFIYTAIAGILVLLAVGLLLLLIIGITVMIAVIIASVKANNGEYWKYPLTIEFLK